MHLGLLHLEQFESTKVNKTNQQHAPRSTAPGATQTKEAEEIRSVHAGLLHLAQFKPKKVKKRNEKYAPGAIHAKERTEYRNQKHTPRATAPGAIQTEESRKQKSEACTWGHCICANGATAPGTVMFPHRQCGGCKIFNCVLPLLLLAPPCS